MRFKYVIENHVMVANSLGTYGHAAQHNRYIQPLGTIVLILNHQLQGDVTMNLKVYISNALNIMVFEHSLWNCYQWNGTETLI